MGGVMRFLEDFPVEDNDGIGSQHRQIARRLCHACLCLLPREARDILLCAFARGTLFFNAGHDTFKRHP
ncbi:hypothetical protein D3C81_2166980 [compost metagenome]